MSPFPLRPFIEVLREALRTLQADPGPRTPEKLDLITQIRKRIAQHERGRGATSSS